MSTVNKTRKHNKAKKYNMLEYLNIVAPILPAPIYWEDVNSVLIGVNNHILQGIGATPAIVGQSLYDFYPFEIADHIVQHNKEVMKTGKILEQEESIEDVTTGEVKHFTAIKAPLRDIDGSIIGIIGTSIDITDRKKAEEQLKIEKEKAEAASKAKSEFITNMSHDIRTPLAGIVSISEALRMKAEDPEEREQLSLVEDCGRQLLNLLNNVLDVASADNAHHEGLKEEAVELAACIRGVAALALPNAKSKNLKLHVNLDPKLPQFVKTDRPKLERILLNFLGNATKFTEEGSVTIGAKLLSQQGNMCQIDWVVSDTGIGIPPEEQEKVFERFFRASPSYRGIYKGNGVGLYIAKKFVELLGGGDIDIKSTVGMGTAFHFILPMEITDAPEIEEEDLSFLTVVPEKNYDVLLVEDTKIARIAAQLVLRDCYCNLDFAETGEEALVKATSHNYDFIFMDIGLPEMSGTEATTLIREWEKDHNRHTPIVGLSAHIDKMIQGQAVRAGMDDVLVKPLSRDQAKKTLVHFVKPKVAKKKTAAKTKKSSAAKVLKKTKVDTSSLFNPDAAIREIGNLKDAKSVLKLLVNETIPQERKALAKAYKAKNWKDIQAHAHKLKGTALYCETKRLAEASGRLEECAKIKAGRSLEHLYGEVDKISLATKKAVEAWLK